MNETNENLNNVKTANDEKAESANERRIYRRKRRIRNQVIAYFVALVLLAGITAGANYGFQSLLVMFRDYQAANAAANVNAVESEPIVEEITYEPIVIEEEVVNVQEEEIFVEEEPVMQVSVLDMIVENCISELTLEEKIAGLFIITPEALTGANNVIRAGEKTREKLLEYPVGGLIYFASNIQSASQLREMLENTKNMSKYPIFLAVDEEGGSVARLAGKNLVPNVGSMEAIGATGDAGNARQAGTTIGTYLSDFGFNVNFAPVADVASLADHPMGTRTFGSDPASVADMVSAFILGAKDTGVSSTLKHFPGLGNTTVDTHVGMAVTERTIDDMRAFDFLPFISGINTGVEFIMMGHVSVPNITGDNTPASLSKMMITDILRTELGFNGIVITDALDMAAITEYYTAAEAAVKALQAGADMILMPESFEEAYIGIQEAIQNGRLSEERINESLRRIYRVKYAGQAVE